MSTGPTVQQLFKQWRNERDGAAGQAMAQKFSDWYYAVTAARLGDKVGREPLERSCQLFAEGIVQVTRTSELVDWAHGIVLQEMASAGGRVPGGDFPNALTSKRSPSQLLAGARGALPPHQLELLAMTFDPSVDMDQLEDVADPHGGVPHAILEARYALKRYLRDTHGVPLQVAPDSPNLDLAPLPLYEATRMESEDEEASFEKWLLSDIELCKDVAEFAAFAHALRAGALSADAASGGAATAAPPRGVKSAPVAAAPGTPATADGASTPAKKGPPLALLVGVFLVVVVVLLAVVALFVAG